MAKKKKPDSSSPNEPNRFRFVEAGMRLTFEFEPLGEIKTSLGHTILFSPVFSTIGWSTHKQFRIALRLKHTASDGREIGRCLVDQDEISAWSQLLNSMLLESDDCDLKVETFEYATRNGVRLVWRRGINWNNAPYFLHISSQQPAVLPKDFISKLLLIFDDFETFCCKYQ